MKITEILFRGKPINPVYGNLVYGNLYVRKDQNNKMYIQRQYGCHAPIQVYPDTVEQYVGLIDKNNKKVFTGDTVRIKGYMANPNLEAIGVVYNDDKLDFPYFKIAWSKNDFTFLTEDFSSLKLHIKLEVI